MSLTGLASPGEYFVAGVCNTELSFSSDGGVSCGGGGVLITVFCIVRPSARLLVFDLSSGVTGKLFL